jgi:hypothetical protein
MHFVPCQQDGSKSRIPSADPQSISVLESAPPHITPARGPPLWEGCDAPVDDGAQGEPDWDLAAQPDEVDQRVNW